MSTTRTPSSDNLDNMDQSSTTSVEMKSPEEMQKLKEENKALQERVANLEREQEARAAKRKSRVKLKGKRKLENSDALVLQKDNDKGEQPNEGKQEEDKKQHHDHDPKHVDALQSSESHPLDNNSNNNNNDHDRTLIQFEPFSSLNVSSAGQQQNQDSQEDNNKEGNDDNNDTKQEDLKKLDFSNNTPPAPSYSYSQRFVRLAHNSAVNFVGTLAVNVYVQPYVPTPYHGFVVTAGTFLVIDTAHSMLHRLLKKEAPLSYLRAYGETTRARVVGFSHEVAKFVVSFGSGIGMSYGFVQAFMKYGSDLEQSDNAATQAFNYGVNDLVITTAVVGFSAWLVSGSMKWLYERSAKPAPKIGPEQDPQLSYLQSTLYHLGLRTGKIAAAFEAFTFAMTSYGLGSLLRDNPEVAVLFAIGFDQAYFEPTRHIGHEHKPVESLVQKTNPEVQGYTLLHLGPDDDVPEKDDDYDLESQPSVSRAPTKGEQAKAVAWIGSRSLVVGVVGVALTYGTEKLAEYMGYKEKAAELSPAERTAAVLTVGSIAIVAERTFENVLPPVARKIAQGGAYVAGSLRSCGSSMWNCMPSLPSLRASKLELDDVQPQRSPMQGRK